MSETAYNLISSFFCYFYFKMNHNRMIRSAVFLECCLVIDRMDLKQDCFVNFNLFCNFFSIVLKESPSKNSTLSFIISSWKFILYFLSINKIVSFPILSYVMKQGDIVFNTIIEKGIGDVVNYEHDSCLIHSMYIGIVCYERGMRNG